MFLLFCLLCLMAPVSFGQIPGPPGQKGAKGEFGEMGIPGDSGAEGVWGQKGIQGGVGTPGRGGLRGRPGMKGYPGSIIMCGQDPYGSVTREFQDLKKILEKLEQVIQHDFIRRAGEKYFVSFKERGSFSEAVDFCSQRGLQLALPENEEENNALTQVFGEGDKMVWISINNGNSATDMKNQPVVFTKWAEGQPDRSVQDTGCTTLTENGFWRVTNDCFLLAYIICQL